MALSPKKMDILPHVNELFKTYDIKVDESSLKLFENNFHIFAILGLLGPLRDPLRP